MKHHLKDEIMERFEYDAGKVIVKKSGQWKGLIGDEAGSLRPDGRRVIQVKNDLLFTHQVVWLMFNDSLPEGTLDHRDTNPTNNRIENLRPATDSEQQGNKKVQKNNTSGYKGVGFRSDIKAKPWKAYIKHEGKSVHLGYFSTAEAAAKCYDEAAKIKFGEFAFLNFKEDTIDVG